MQIEKHNNARARICCMFKYICCRTEHGNTKYDGAELWQHSYFQSESTPNPKEAAVTHTSLVGDLEKKMLDTWKIKLNNCACYVVVNRRGIPWHIQIRGALIFSAIFIFLSLRLA